MRHGHLYTTILGLALVGLYGCGDDVTDPDAFLESAEAEAVMESARDLPMLPDLIDTAMPPDGRERAALLRANELWSAGTVDGPRADARRRLAVIYALPVLVESLPPEAWSEAREGLDDWIVTIQAMVQHLAMPEVQERVTAARRHLIRADATRDDRRRKSYYTLLAMSELVETTPRFVALRLVAEATAAMEAYHATYDGRVGKAVQRAQRLKDWAERAVLEEDYLLAIQRAYYAIQLVEGS